MPDISMCMRMDCPIKKSCYRFTAKPTERQAYMNFEFKETENLRGCSAYENNGERCGDCENCKKLKKVQKSVLKTVNPPFSHPIDLRAGSDYGAVDLWNQELKRLPCLRREA